MIYFSQRKTNQEGLDWGKYWHAQYNPNDTAILTVNVLEMYIFKIPSRLWVIGIFYWFDPLYQVHEGN